jgi:pimeloyl-ACP methyl ester carboxylesterase
VHSLVLLELSLLSVPSGAAFFEQAGPAFATYASGDHEGALSKFMSVASGLDWPTCRSALEAAVPGAVAQAVKDADTFFGVELPALGEWAFGRDQAAGVIQPVLSVLGAQTHPLWVEVADFLSSSLPNVETCTIDRVGHLLHIQRPEPVARAMANFFARNAIAEVPTDNNNQEAPCPSSK